MYIVLLCSRFYEIRGTSMCFTPDTGWGLNSLDGMSGLTSLTLSFNQFTPFPLVTQKIPHIENIFFTNMDLCDDDINVPDGTAGLSHLERASFSYNRLQSIPNFTGSARSLIALDVSYNDITFIEINSLAILANLEFLYLQSNMVTNPQDLRFLSNLQVLNMR